jgi:hypothetical protein
VTISINIPRITQRERRVISLSTLIVVLGLILGRALPAWRQVSTAEHRRATVLADSVTKMRFAIKSGAKNRDSVAAARRRLDRAASAVLVSTSREAAEAKLIGILSNAADDIGLDVTSLQAIGDALIEPKSRRLRPSLFRTVGVRGSARGDIQTLVDLVSFVDTSSHTLALQSFSVTQARNGRMDSSPEELQMEFVVRALTSASSSQKAAGPR